MHTVNPSYENPIGSAYPITMFACWIVIGFPRLNIISVTSWLVKHKPNCSIPNDWEVDSKVPYMPAADESSTLLLCFTIMTNK